MTLFLRLHPSADANSRDSLSRSYRFSFDIVKIAVESTDAQIGTLDLFRCLSVH